MYFTSFRGQRLLFRWYTNHDYNYTKSNLSQLKLNNSSTTLSVCGLEWLYLTISAKLQSHHTSATNLIPLLQSFSYKESPSSYQTQVSLVIKALNTQNGSFKYLLRKVWTIGDTNGVIISLNHLEKKVLFWKRLSSLFLQLFSSSDRFRELASIETGEKILNGWRRHPCSGGNCCAGGEKQVQMFKSLFLSFVWFPVKFWEV